MIDALQRAKDLGKSFEPKQAEAPARAFGQQGERLVTKLDLEVEATKLRSEFKDLRIEVDSRFSKVDIQFAGSVAKSKTWGPTLFAGSWAPSLLTSLALLV